jgi:tRNA(Ile)-lysidine synthase
VTADGSDSLDNIRRHFHPGVPGVIGVAVSGGSDSLALLYLLRDWRAEGGPDLRAATVDHGLRAYAAA